MLARFKHWVAGKAECPHNLSSCLLTDELLNFFGYEIYKHKGTISFPSQF